jgi:hypothetical protein
VAVVPGYVKCPRCHAVLPRTGRARRSSVDPGGTSVAERRSSPLVPALIVTAAIAVVLFLVLGGDPKKKAGAGSAAASPLGAPSAGAAPAAPAPLDIPPAGPSPGAAAADLERALGRERLWSSVQASGARVDVRSGACGEPAMGPVIEAARSALRGAGLTRLRCLAQSGAVVFERDL